MKPVKSGGERAAADSFALQRNHWPVNLREIDLPWQFGMPGMSSETVSAANVHLDECVVFGRFHRLMERLHLVKDQNFMMNKNDQKLRRLSKVITATALIAGTTIVSGCATTTTSNTARTGSEQLLISAAIDRSISKVRFSDFSGYKVFINETYLEGVDKGYLVGSLRHGVLKNGGSIVPTAEAADVILEARSGGIGTDGQESFVGIPGLGIPGLPIELPEIKFASRNTQMGTAKIGLVCYDAKTGAVMGDGGQATALTHNNDSYYLGIGPFKSGTLLEQREKAIGFNGVGGSMFSNVKKVAHADVKLVQPNTGGIEQGYPFDPEYQVATGPKSAAVK